MARVKPRYIQIADELRERIASGELARGERLPPQRDLAGSFGVTVMTLRQALDLLGREGLLATRERDGTYVGAAPVAYALGGLRSFAQELADQGVELETRVLGHGPAQASEREIVLLELPGRRVHAVERLRLAAGVPVALQRSLVPPGIWAWLGRVELGGASLYDVLAAAGLRPGRARETLRPELAAPDDAALLAIEPGSPVLRSERLTFGEDGNPLLLDVAILAGERIVVEAERVAGSASVLVRLGDSA